MKTAMLAVMLFGVVGCGHRNDTVSVSTPKIQTVGPLTIVSSAFDFHQTLAYPDGTEFEFRHAGYEEALADEGSVVEITFIGKLHSDRFDNQIIGVKVLKHSDEYIKHHPELWPPRKAHWQGGNFILDDGSNRICGSVDDRRIIDEGWIANVDGDVGRSSMYTKFTDRESAMKAVEKSCI